MADIFACGRGGCVYRTADGLAITVNDGNEERNGSAKASE